MTDPNAMLSQLQYNLGILLKRRDKYGNPPRALIKQIDDHEKAIVLTKRVIAGGLSEAGWIEVMKPLLVAIYDRSEAGGECYVEIGDVGGSIINSIIAGRDVIINNPPADEPPFWKRLSRANLILAIVLGLIITTAAVLAVPGVSDVVYGWFTPLPFPRAGDDETLIVIATFHETAANKTEPHVKIKRAIEEAAETAGLDTLRVEIEPTELTADRREEAEALGKRYKAAMVIWGEDTGVQVMVNFFNLKQPDFQAARVEIIEEQRTQIANPGAYADFIVHDLPGQQTFLALFAVGQSFYQTGNYQRAKDIIEQGIASLTSDTQIDGLTEAYFRLGWLYQIPLQNLELARERYNKSIELNPQLAPAYNNRGIVYADLKQYEAALADFIRAIELNPEDADAYIGRGSTYSALKQYEAALVDYTRAIALNPEYAMAYNNRGNTYKALKQDEAALADYTRAIALNPKYADAFYNRALTYSYLQQYEAVLADYTRAIALNPEYAMAYNNRGVTYNALQQYEAALTDYTRAIALNPEVAYGYYSNRGATYKALQQYEAALADFNRAIELDPEFATAYNDRGLTYYDLKQYEAALADYTRAIELNPEYAKTYYNIACVYALQNQIEATLPPLRRALELAPDECLSSIPTDTVFDLIRDDPRFQALLAEFAPKQ